MLMRSKPRKEYILHLYRQLLRGTNMLADEKTRQKAQKDCRDIFRERQSEKNFVKIKQHVKDAENRMAALIAKLEREKAANKKKTNCPVNSQDILLLYRDILTYIRELDDKEMRKKYREDCRRLFRQNRNEDDPGRIYTLYMGGVTKLSVLKIRVPPVRIPYHVRTRKLTFLGAGEEAYLMGEDGVPLSEVSIHEQHHKDYRYDLGYEHVDPDDLKRHHAIIERMQYRGPVWEKYAREGPPEGSKPTDPEILSQFPEGYFDAGVYDYKQKWFKGQFKSPFWNLANRTD